MTRYKKNTLGMHIFRPCQKHLRIFKNIGMKLLYDLRTQGGDEYPPVRKYEKRNTFFEKVGVVLKGVDCGLHLHIQSWSIEGHSQLWVLFLNLHFLCLYIWGRVVTKVVRTCDPTPLLYQILAIKHAFAGFVSSKEIFKFSVGFWEWSDQA